MVQESVIKHLYKPPTFQIFVSFVVAVLVVVRVLLKRWTPSWKLENRHWHHHSDYRTESRLKHHQRYKLVYDITIGRYVEASRLDVVRVCMYRDATAVYVAVSQAAPWPARRCCLRCSYLTATGSSSRTTTPARIDRPLNRYDACHVPVTSFNNPAHARADTTLQ